MKIVFHYNNLNTLYSHRLHLQIKLLLFNVYSICWPEFINIKVRVWGSSKAFGFLYKKKVDLIHPCF